MIGRKQLGLLSFLACALIGFAGESRDEGQRLWEKERALEREKNATAWKELLTGVDELEVMTLDPASEMDDEQKSKVDPELRLDRWMPRLKIRVTDPKQIAQLRTGLLRSIETSADGVAPCFSPRHGIRFHKAGAEISVIVCFECAAMEVHGSAVLKSASISPAAAQDFYLVFRAQGLTKPPRLGSTNDAELAGRLVGTWSKTSRDRRPQGPDTVWDQTEIFRADGTYHSETRISFVAANSEPSEWDEYPDDGTWRIEHGMLFIAGTKPDGFSRRISYEYLTPLIEISGSRVSYGSLEPGSDQETVWERK